MAVLEQVHTVDEALYADMVEFAKKIIQLRSDTGQEKEVAEAILLELKKLGFDETVTDRTGNIAGIIRGDGTGDSVMFNCHMDQVGPGVLTDWEYDPFKGVVDGGYIHGRGASDTKGAIAAQIYAGALIKKLGIPLAGDLLFSFVVEEEPGDMWGIMRFCEDWLKERKPAICILGEATSLNIALGHRGRLEIEIISKGLSSHSSAPWRGVNAVSKMASMITELDKLANSMPSHEIMGASSLSIIHISCVPGFNCVVPGSCTLYVDRRFVPGETSESILAEIRQIASMLTAADPESHFEVRVRELNHFSYTGFKGVGTMNKPAFLTDEKGPVVQKVIKALNKAGQHPKTELWDFGTDGAYVYHHCGIPVIGYSPCEEKYAHKTDDRVSIDMMRKALAGYAMICAEISGIGELTLL
jgi:putative selenium metabolism hydrolase